MRRVLAIIGLTAALAGGGAGAVTIWYHGTPPAKHAAIWYHG